MTRAIRVAPDHASLVAVAAEHIALAAGETRWRPRLALAGGSTPAPVYERLAEEPYRSRLMNAFPAVTLTDERCVPPDSHEANALLVVDHWLERAPVRGATFLRFPAERGAEAGARAANAALRAWALRTPLFDLVLLGLGDDGHTASLFPGTSHPEDGRWVIPARHPSGQERVSLSPAALRSSAHTLFLVAGEGKAAAVRDTLLAEPGPDHPAAGVGSAFGPTTWLLDAAAASLLPPEIDREEVTTGASAPFSP